ncbi:MAG: TerB family tellurite resistance protein [Paracoccaceae bacterium]
MFNTLITSLKSETPAPADLQLALAALMVRVAKADGIYVFEEIRQIDAILAKRFALTPVDATKLRDRAQALEKTAPETIAFATSLKSAIPFAERSAIVAAMWDVMLADGQIVPSEATAFHDVARVLGVDTSDLET